MMRNYVLILLQACRAASACAYVHQPRCGRVPHCARHRDHDHAHVGGCARARACGCASPSACARARACCGGAACARESCRARARAHHPQPRPASLATGWQRQERREQERENGSKTLLEPSLPKSTKEVGERKVPVGISHLCHLDLQRRLHLVRWPLGKGQFVQ